MSHTTFSVFTVESKKMSQFVDNSHFTLVSFMLCCVSHICIYLLMRLSSMSTKWEKQTKNRVNYAEWFVMIMTQLNCLRKNWILKNSFWEMGLQFIGWIYFKFIFDEIY